jgi:transposase
MIAKSLLAVRAVLRNEFKVFEKQVRKMARSDTRTRLLMSIPAVGPIVALKPMPAPLTTRPVSNRRSRRGPISD